MYETPMLQARRPGLQPHGRGSSVRLTRSEQRLLSRRPTRHRLRPLSGRPPRSSASPADRTVAVGRPVRTALRQRSALPVWWRAGSGVGRGAGSRPATCGGCRRRWSPLSTEGASRCDSNAMVGSFRSMPTSTATQAYSCGKAIANGDGIRPRRPYYRVMLQGVADGRPSGQAPPGMGASARKWPFAPEGIAGSECQAG